MKKYLVYMTCAAAAMIGGTGCSDFGDVNMDPEHLNSENIPTELLFTNGQHQMLGSDWDVWRNGCIYAAQWMSHTASFNWLGNANYTWNDGYSGAYWEIYNGDTRGALRDMKDAVEAWKEDPSRQTDYQIARIMLAYGMHRMTDLYGDIPYSQAVQPELYSFPEYDTQQSIYMDLLKELNEAQAALNGASAAAMTITTATTVKLKRTRTSKMQSIGATNSAECGIMTASELPTSATITPSARILPSFATNTETISAVFGNAPEEIL